MCFDTLACLRPGLVFLIIPDLVFSFFCGVTCALNAANGDYVSAGWCRFQVVYCVWGIGSNAWLNAAIARHVHDMLRCGQAMKRYFAPTRRQVVLEASEALAQHGCSPCTVQVRFVEED